MFATLKTLLAGAGARAEEQVQDHFCIELIDQKTREAEAALKSAKLSLAGLIQGERAEVRQLGSLTRQIDDLTTRARAALEAGRDALAQDAAQAIAEMENEATLRRATVERLQARTAKLRHSVETANRRLTDLKQGALAARAAKREADMQRRLGAHLGGLTAFEEAEAMIARVLSRDDPFEQGEILREIDGSLTHRDAADRLAEAGFGPPVKSTAADVLARLKSKD